MPEKSLLLVAAARWCGTRLRENKVPFFTSLAVGLLCHLFAFTNKLPNHDEAYSLFIKGATVDSGRWGLGALDTIFPNYSMPWIYGLLTLLLMACAVCLMIRVLSLKNPCLQALLAGVVIAFPSLTATLAYMFTSSSFALAFLLAAAAVWLLRQRKKALWVVALGFMIFSLSIYQSYISLAAGLLVTVLIGDLLRGAEPKETIRKGIGYVVFLVLSLGSYYLLTQFILVWKDVTLNAYAAGNMDFRLSGIPHAIALSYQSFFRFFTEGYRGLIPTPLSRGVHILLLVLTLGMLLKCCLSLRKPGAAALVAGLAAVLPLAVNCMYLFTTPKSIHTLVLYGFVCFYALALLLCDCLLTDPGRKALGTAAVNGVTLGAALIIVCNIYLANQVWLNLHLRYENAYSFYTSLMADLRAQPSFTPDSKLALLGTYSDPAFYEEKFPQLTEITGVKGFLPDSYSRDRFLEYYIGLSIPFASDEETETLSRLPEVRDMPVYPYHGSIAAFGDTIVIKLSQP